MPEAPREELKKVLKDFFYRELLSSGDVEAPQTVQLEALIEERVEALLRRFEDGVLSQRVKSLIIEDVKTELVKSTQLDKTIDLSLLLLSTAMAFLVAAVTATLGVNLSVLTIRGVGIDVFWFSIAALILTVVQLVLFVIWKFRR